jgi:hypothetical protein
MLLNKPFGIASGRSRGFFLVFVPKEGRADLVTINAREGAMSVG